MVIQRAFDETRRSLGPPCLGLRQRAWCLRPRLARVAADWTLRLVVRSNDETYSLMADERELAVNTRMAGG